MAIRRRIGWAIETLVVDVLVIRIVLNNLIELVIILVINLVIKPVLGVVMCSLRHIL